MIPFIRSSASPYWPTITASLLEKNGQSIGRSPLIVQLRTPASAKKLLELCRGLSAKIAPLYALVLIQDESSECVSNGSNFRLSITSFASTSPLLTNLIEAPGFNDISWSDSAANFAG